MKPYQYFLFSLTLVVFLLSLAGHFALEAPICCRLDRNVSLQENSNDQSGLDVCLVCQLQLGVYFQDMPFYIAVVKIAVSNSDSSSPLDFVSQLLRPPILL